MLTLALLLLPAALLFALLALGFYPGEQLLAPAGRGGAVLFIAGSRTRRLPRPPARSGPRGGGLVAHALAGRAPPRF